MDAVTSSRHLLFSAYNGLVGVRVAWFDKTSSHPRFAGAEKGDVGDRVALLDELIAAASLPTKRMRHGVTVYRVTVPKMVIFFFN